MLIAAEKLNKKIILIFAIQPDDKVSEKDTIAKFKE
jgi:hypothetical protein